MAAIDKAAMGWAIGIVAVGVAIAFGLGGQQGAVEHTPYTPSTTTEGGEFKSPSVASQQGEIRSDTGLGAVLNKEQWAEDPFGDISAKVREQQGAEPAKVEEAAEPTEMKEEASVSVSAPEVEEAPVASGPMTVNVSMPAGTSVPGCEETNECYIPASVTINVGDTVNWINDDTAAHTVTSGVPTEGPSGVFDSSLVMGGASYEFTFNDSGSYDYFCMVHPWMVGDVQVN